MMKQLIIYSFSAMVLVTSACTKARIKGEGNIISENRNLSDFSQLSADGEVSVDVYPSNIDRVVVTGYQNLVPIYQTNVSGDRLHLKFEDGYFNVRNNNIHVDVYTTQLSGVKLSGSGHIIIHDSVRSARMDAEISGSGAIDIGNNHYQVMDLDVSGSGDINAVACTSNKVYAKISGSGNLKITVSELLQANISGSGDIDYWGDPKTVDTHISGSGKVRKH